MVIDFHTHIFPDKIAGKTVSYLKNIAQIPAHTDGTARGLLSSMESGGVDCSVILPVVTSPGQFDTIARFADQINTEYSDPNRERRLLSFGGIHPDTPDYKQQLRILAESGFRGVKLHPDYQGTDFNDIRCKRIVSRASELGLIVAVHAGVDIGFPEPVRCTPRMALDVIRDVQPDKLVLAHYGGWKKWDEVEQFLVGEQVYFDTAFTQGYLKEEQFLRILKRHGSDRILFATDSPWSGQKETQDWLRGMGLPGAARTYPARQRRKVTEITKPPRHAIPSRGFCYFFTEIIPLRSSERPYSSAGSRSAE